MKIIKIGTVVFTLLFNQLNAQEKNEACGTVVPGQAWDNWFNQKVEELKAGQIAGKTTFTNYTIPVIIHVIHGGEAVGTFPNLSLAQLNSQIAVLNHDYAGTGYNTNTVPSVFANLIANTGVQFCMALKDPNGNTLAEPGIERINCSSKGWTNPHSISNSTNNTTFINYMDNTIKPASIWDPVKYLNIWVSDRPNGGLGLGYAMFPAGSGLSGITSGVGTSTNDGLWCWGQCFGTTGTLASGYDKGRVSSHEIGHYLGLRHIWGDANCASDYCSDTPPSQDANYNCPTFPHNQGTCSGNTNGEMTMNIMDYTNDPCKYMFTPNQATRMQTAMANGTNRKLLGTHGLCSTIGIDANPDEVLLTSLTVFPNPSTGSFEVRFNHQDNTVYTIQLCDVLGCVVFSESNRSSAYPGNFTVKEKGMYLLIVSSAKEKIVKKIIVE